MSICTKKVPKRDDRYQKKKKSNKNKECLDGLNSKLDMERISELEDYQQNFQKLKSKEKRLKKQNRISKVYGTSKNG